MVAGCGAKMSKLILFIANFVLWVVSISLIGFGIWMLVASSKFEAIFAEDNIMLVGGIILGVGVFAFVVGFCGCCGALKESLCLLRMYFAFLCIIVLVEFVGGILAFVFRSGIEESMMEGMTSAIHDQYGKSSAATDAIDMVQREFDCCGAHNYTDYIGSEYEKDHGIGTLPGSCCSTGTQESNNCTIVSPDRYDSGCVEASISAIEDNILIVGLISFGFIVVEVFVMSFVCCLISGVQKNSYTNFA